MKTEAQQIIEEAAEIRATFDKKEIRSLVKEASSDFIERIIELLDGLPYEERVRRLEAASAQMSRTVAEIKAKYPVDSPVTEEFAADMLRLLKTYENTIRGLH